MERLDKFLCDSGAGTRSQVKTILKSGRVTLDGKTVKHCLRQNLLCGLLLGRLRR